MFKKSKPKHNKIKLPTGSSEEPVLHTEKLRKKRNRTASPPPTPAAPTRPLAKVFVKSAVRRPHRAAPTLPCAPKLDGFFEIPERYQIDNSRLQDASEKTYPLSGIMEIPLSIRTQLANIESTERARNNIFPSQYLKDQYADDYELHKELHLQSKLNEKAVERAEKLYRLQGKRLKSEREDRSSYNKSLES